MIVLRVEVAVALLKDGIRDCIWVRKNGSLKVPTMIIATQEIKRTIKLVLTSVRIIPISPTTGGIKAKLVKPTNFWTFPYSSESKT